jgi:hypothetical protein
MPRRDFAGKERETRLWETMVLREVGGEIPPAYSPTFILPNYARI